MKNNSRYLQMLSGAVAASIVISHAPLALAQIPIAPKPNSSTAKTTTAKTLNHALDAELRAAANNAAKVRDLLARGADPNTKYSDPDATPLLANAALFGNLEVVRALVEAGADVQAPNKEGMTPLSHAVLTENNLEIVKYLLQRGAKTESKTPSGMTPLMSAASSGQSELVRILMNAGASIHAVSEINATPLFYACDNKDAPDERMKIARMLVEAGADVSVAASHNGQRADQAAAANNLLDTEKYLIGVFNRDAALYNATAKAYADRDVPNENTWAANWQAVKTALAAGANPRFASNHTGETPLIFLARSLRGADDKTCQAIIARSDLNAQESKYGCTALHTAVAYNNIKMIDWLIKAGAHLNIIDKNKRTPLDMPGRLERQEAVALLKTAGAKTYEEVQDNIDLAFFGAMLSGSGDSTPKPSTPVASPTVPSTVPPAPVVAAAPANTVAKSPLDKIIMEGYDQGVTVLMRAARAGDVAEVERLLKAGATVDIVGPENGNTALFFAASGNSPAAIQLLVKAGANINFLNHNGDPPLVTASFRRNAATIRSLVEAGADLKYLDAALENAKDGENAAVLEYLTSLKTAPKPPVANTPKPVTKAPTSTPAASKPDSAPYKSTTVDEMLHFALIQIDYKKTVEQKVSNADWSAVRVALGEGATSRYADKKGVTALMLIAATLPGAEDDIERQIFERADINAQDKEGSTALHYAARYGHVKMVHWLIAAKANLNILDNSKWTPLDVANVNRQSAAATALKNAGAKTAD